MDWDFTKLEIQDSTHYSAMASSSGSGHGAVLHHHQQQQHDSSNSMVDDIFSVDLKLGRVMDDQYGVSSMEVFHPTNYQPCAPATMTLMGASPPFSSIRRGRGGSGSGSQQQQPVCCLVDGCSSDLSSSREYHRRHRVCERHSKTPVVLVGGEEQRFCQQCSRFHPLCEFDEVKRSCRKRLDGHNRRRRKTQPNTTLYNINSSTSTAVFTASSCSPASALMDFIRNAPQLPVFPPPHAHTPWPMAAPLQPHVDFLLPTSSSSSPPPSSYPFMPYGFGDQLTRQRTPPHNDILHQSSMMCHQMVTNHTQPSPELELESSGMGNINCALSLLSSAAMDNNNSKNSNNSSSRSSPAGINVAGHPFAELAASHEHHQHHHLFPSNSHHQNDLEGGSSGSYAGVFHHSAGGTHDLHQSNHGFGLNNNDAF